MREIGVMICRKYRVCRSGLALQISFHSYNERVRSPRMARYRRWRYAQSALRKAKADSSVCSSGFNRSLTTIKKHPSIEGCFFMAAEPGFEPRRTESESAVLPLHNSALFSAKTIVSQGFSFVKPFFHFFKQY